MQKNFTKALPVTLKYEGGWSNNPRDPGGVTLEGVIQRVYDAYRKRKGLKTKPLTPKMRGTAAWISERNEIFREQYWNAVRGDDLPSGIDLVVWDGAVNSGPYQSTLWLQRALSAQGLYHDAIDGHIGENTLLALKLCQDNDALVADICARRLGMLKHLSTWDEFGDGWSARVASLKAIAQAWASGSVGPQPVEVHELGGMAKAYASDVMQPAIDADDATKLGVGGAGAAGVVQGAQQQLAPFVGTSDFMTKVYTVLTVLGVVIAICGFAYSVYAMRKRKKAQGAINGEAVAYLPESQAA